MAFDELIRTMARSIAAGDGDAAAACFHAEGVYHDVFYGAFSKPEIPRMVSDYFHRDATAFVWDMHDPIANGDIGYARYVFSYEGRMAGATGRRAIFEGVSVCRLRDGLILNYHEVANVATGLALLDFAPERIAKIARRQGAELAARPEAAGHRVAD